MNFSRQPELNSDKLSSKIRLRKSKVLQLLQSTKIFYQLDRILEATDNKYFPNFRREFLNNRTFIELPKLLKEDILEASNYSEILDFFLFLANEDFSYNLLTCFSDTFFNFIYPPLKDEILLENKLSFVLAKFAASGTQNSQQVTLEYLLKRLNSSSEIAICNALTGLMRMMARSAEVKGKVNLLVLTNFIAELISLTSNEDLKLACLEFFSYNFDEDPKFLVETIKRNLANLPLMQSFIVLSILVESSEEAALLKEDDNFMSLYEQFQGFRFDDIIGLVVLTAQLVRIKSFTVIP